MNKNMDMLHGTIGDKLMTFALPLAATGILQQLFNAADIAVVGRCVGKNAMAAVGSNTPVTALILSLFTGISIGANVVISTLIGQRKPEKVNKAVHTALLFAFVGGVIFALICELLSRQILSRMSIPDEVFGMALLYFRVYVAGMPVILLYDFASAVFRSHGNTRTPLICLLTSGVINVLLNLFFVLVLKMTVNGVALATVISNLISSVLLIFFLMREKSEIHFSFKKLGIDKKAAQHDDQHRTACGHSGHGIRHFQHNNTVLDKQAGQRCHGGIIGGIQHRDIRLLHTQFLRAGVYDIRGAELRCKTARKVHKSYKDSAGAGHGHHSGDVNADTAGRQTALIHF